jgi:transcriptional regulator with GAF, ATPase, and Fis domain
MTRPLIVFTLALAAGCSLLGFWMQDFLSPIDERIAHVSQSARGANPADTNIVILYIDNDAITTLGWPVRRNFYALLLHTVADLKPRAVGLELVFEDTKVGYQEFPEYDTLLALTARSVGNAVFGAYFDRVDATPDSGAAISSIGYSRTQGPFPNGHGIHLPFNGLLGGAAGIGHVNFGGEAPDFPLVIHSGGTSIPSFAVEVFRVATGTSRSDVFYRDGLVMLDPSGRERVIPVGENGSARLFFPGPLQSYAHYPLLEVLRSYDAVRHGMPPAIPVLSFQNKIILVGVLAEGRGAFRPTVLDAQTPSILIHAAFLHDALSGKFRSEPGWLLAFLLQFALAACAAFTVGMVRRPLNILLGGVIGLLPLLAFPALYLGAAIMIPATGMMVSTVVAGVVALSVRWRTDGSVVDSLERERNSVLAQLREREAKVTALERELSERAQDQHHSAGLMEELRKYKAEMHALSNQAQDFERFDPQESESAGAEEFEGIVYARTGVMRPVVEFIRKIAGSDAPVLVLGESGTGKERVARAIHKKSKRSGGPFIAVNCGALSETLLESELFGHEKGAFTGAVREKRGRFELAGGGTIFLDEIGEVSEAFQLKLLRVIQEGELERVGGTATLRVDVRVVAATNKDLKEAVSNGKFREDLYYRLNVLTLEIPPLRDRPEDIDLLLHHFLEKEGGGLSVSKGVAEIFAAHSWPGNVRELESAVKRAVLMAKADGRSMIVARDLPQDLALKLRGSVPVHEQVLDLVRAKGFSRSSVTDSAVELGGLNRGTVAEYLRGEFLRVFVESGFNAESAARTIALSTDEAVLGRVRKRMAEYLANIAAGVDRSAPWSESLPGLKPKIKNLPQRYHLYVEQTGEAFHRGTWTNDQGGI